MFGNGNQWATAREVLPAQFNMVQSYEREFKVTIHRSLDVLTQANNGKVYPSVTPELTQSLRSTHYDKPILMQPWVLPAGAYGQGHGPT